MAIFGFKVQPITSQERRDMIGQRKWPDQVQFRMTSAENIPRVLTFETRTTSLLGEQD